MLITLAAQIAAFTGQPVALDPRLQPPECTVAIGVRWTSTLHDGVVVTCPAPGWRLFVPVGRAVPAVLPAYAAPEPQASVAPAVRKGDRVTLAAQGPGFRVTVDAVAETDAIAGARIRLRNRVSGEVIQGLVGDGGEISLPGFKATDGSR